jgi:hypothetical protein
MLIVNSGTFSYIYPTVTEKSTGTTSSFVFEFTHTQTKEVLTATVSNESVWTSRYDKFKINKAGASLTEGFWDYRAWENGFTASICEEGKAYVAITSTKSGATSSTTYVVNQNRIVYGS